MSRHSWLIKNMKLANAVFMYSFKRYSFQWKLTSLIIFTASLTRPSLRAHIASLRLIYTSRLMSFAAVGGQKTWDILYTKALWGYRSNIEGVSIKGGQEQMRNAGGSISTGILLATLHCTHTFAVRRPSLQRQTPVVTLMSRVENCFHLAGFTRWLHARDQ